MDRMDGDACTIKKQRIPMTGCKSDEWLCSKELKIKKIR
jgi:hypothetical protein